MSGERLELVRKWSELRAGMRIVDIAGCDVCEKRPVRGMVFHLHEQLLNWDDDDDAKGVPSWEILPGCGCVAGEFYAIGESHVISGDVYRVIDPDADKTETTETPRKLVKT